MNDELLRLAERCEAATGPDRELSASIALAVHDWLHEVEGNKPLNCRVRNKLGSPVYIGGETGRAMDYTASIDAALTLVPEGRTILNIADDGITTAIVCGTQGIGDTPALALCAAVLRARAATETANG